MTQSKRHAFARALRESDWVLIGLIAVLSAIGLLNLFSATDGTRHAVKYGQQMRWFGLGLAVFVVVAAIDYRAWLRHAWNLLGLAIILLIVIDVVGYTAKGSTRWLTFAGFRLQPSEPAKLALIVALARMFRNAELAQFATSKLALRLGALCLPLLLVMVQPDLGTATLMALILLSTGYLLVPNVRPLLLVTLVGVVLIPFGWEILHTYQKARILAFLDPAADPTGIGWHTQQSVLAVGSGQLTGKGFRGGTQNQFDFLPEHWTDFPFSVWAEEWGFLGSAALLLLFSFLVLWIINSALRARDAGGAAICVGVAAMTFWHVFVNVAMVLGLAPVVGVTLPFISYGGSSAVSFFAAMGLVASVARRRHGH